MTHDRIQEVLDVARSRYDNLASLSDAIALLDMCHSFADKVSSSTLPWSRPTVNTEGGGTLTIQKGRYGIEVSCAGLMTPSTTTAIAANHFVPNDTYAPGHRNFTVLTGVNGSGKSTYLKQIAIIVVLAHCGSYVPSESAIVPVCLAIFNFNLFTSSLIKFSLESRFEIVFAHELELAMIKVRVGLKYFNLWIVNMLTTHAFKIFVQSIISQHSCLR